MASEEGPCRLMPSGNSTLPVAKYWENIPETLILNSLIGLILYVIFRILTDSSRATSLKSPPSLINFLYAYRDPDIWCVMPRYEFIRDTRRHSHDPSSHNMYVPPRLPIANPVELLGHQQQEHMKQLQQQSRPRQINGQPQSQSLRQQQQHQDQEPQQGGKNFLVYPSVLTDEQMLATRLGKFLNHVFSKFYRISDADIIYAKGIDAYEYLLFQRHLILIMLFTNLFCLGLLLPVNWLIGTKHLGKEATFANSFQRSTIKNLDANSNCYLAHITACVSIAAVSILILASYKSSISVKDANQLARRTLLIGNLSKDQRDRPRLLEVFRKYFAKCKLEAVQFAYDTSELENLQRHLSVIKAARLYCDQYKQKYNQELLVKPTDVNEGHYCGGFCRLCSCCYICCCVWPLQAGQPGTSFYANEETQHRARIATLCEKLVQSPREYAFATFRTHKQARRVFETLSKLKSDHLNGAGQDDERSSSSRSISELQPRPSSSKDSSESQSSGRHRPIVKSLPNGPAVAAVARQLAHERVLVLSKNSTSDPLDPTNNPQIRSIRSPVVKSRHRVAIKSKNSETHEAAMMSSAATAAAEPEPSKSYHPPGPIGWSVRYAPHPDNVEYADLLNLNTTSKLTTVLYHLLMILIFIFFTTPNVLLSIFEQWIMSHRGALHSSYEAVLINYLTILLQIITTALLPALIILISKQIPYEDTASKNTSIMCKAYIFLVLMVIVMPSLGMSSAQALFSSNIDTKCLFPTDNGAYFIKYVISSIFLSTILELIKPMDILSYCFILFTGRSRADFEASRYYIEREFSVGMNHTSVLLIFSVVMTYAISCPLIAPAGLVYLIVKHQVDHYHLFYSYFTKKVDASLQNTIMLFVRAAILLMLFQTMVAISISTGTSYFSLVSQIVFWTVLAAFLLNWLYEFTSKAMDNVFDSDQQRRQEFCACFYLPKVIDDLLRVDAIPESCISRQTLSSIKTSKPSAV